MLNFSFFSRLLLRSTVTMTSPPKWQECGVTWRMPTHVMSSPTPVPLTLRLRPPTKMWRGDWPSNSPADPSWNKINSQHTAQKHHFQTCMWLSSWVFISGIFRSLQFFTVTIKRSDVGVPSAQMSALKDGSCCFATPDVMDFRDSVHSVYGFAITETDMAKEKWSGR